MQAFVLAGHLFRLAPSQLAIRGRGRDSLRMESRHPTKLGGAESLGLYNGAHLAELSNASSAPTTVRLTMKSFRRAMMRILIALTLIVTSCGERDEVAMTIPPEIGAILAAAADAMGNVETVRFTIDRAGAPVLINLGEGLGDLLEFKGAEGRFARPNSADALVTVNVEGFTTQIGALAIDGKIWLSFFGGKWQPAPPSFQFDPASLFDPNQGFRQLFLDGLANATLLGEEVRNGVDTYHIRGRASEERVEAITATLTRDQAVDLEVWIDLSTGEMVDASFSTEVTDGTVEWTMKFREYGADITIAEPDTGDGD